MSTINLAARYESKLDERFHLQSRTEAFCGSNYSWEGANAIKVWTLESAPLGDYDATASSNRFGTPTEVDDEVNTYALTRKRSFAKVFDVTNVQDQMFVKKANAYLKQMWDERYVPEIDAVRFEAWVKGAGFVTLNGTALTKTTVMEAILNAHAALDDAFVPSENRATFVRTDVAVATKLATELANSQNWIDKAVIRGKIGEINGSPVITVPQSLLPVGVEFIVKYKNATADPMKLRMLRANDNAPGYAGTLMEGLCRYDSFVLANKAEGIYVYAQSGACATPTASLSSGKIALATTTSGATVYYTTDGTNPKTSATRSVYTAALTVESGKTLRAFAVKTGLIDSGIMTVREDEVS